MVALSFFDRRELHDDHMALFRSYFYNSRRNSISIC